MTKLKKRNNILFLFALPCVLAAATPAFAQISGNIAVEITVRTLSDSKPVNGAGVFLNQILNGSSAGTSMETDSNGFVALEAVPASPTVFNTVEINCRIARKRVNLTQTIYLFSHLQTDRLYTRTVYLNLPKGYSNCD